MPRSGRDYLNDMTAEPRDVRLLGERIAEPASHPAFRNTFEAYAGLYDFQCAPENLELMTYETETGQRVNRAWSQPQSYDELVERRRAIEAGEGSREDRKLLSRVVAEDADLAADLGALRRQLDRPGPDELHGAGVVTEEAEVVDGIPVQGEYVDLFVIEKDGLGSHRPRHHHVAVGQDETPFVVDDEARRARDRGPFGVEGSGGGDAQRDHGGNGSLDDRGPLAFPGLGCGPSGDDGHGGHCRREGVGKPS